jgi:hypothetical protein
MLAAHAALRACMSAGSAPHARPRAAQLLTASSMAGSA